MELYPRVEVTYIYNIRHGIFDIYENKARNPNLFPDFCKQILSFIKGAKKLFPSGHAFCLYLLSLQQLLPIYHLKNQILYPLEL